MVQLDVDAANAIFLPIRNDGKFEGKTLNVLRRLGKRRKVFMLAFPPKAAGTFLSSAVAYAIDGQIVRAVHAQGGRDATPYLPTFISYYCGGITEDTFVTHVHMLALPANLHFLDAFDIRPVVMKRNIPDMLVSYRDMLDRDDVSLQEGLNCHIPANFREISDAAKADFLVDVLGPWYANFYSGWLRRVDAEPDRVCVLDYLDLLGDPAGTLGRIFDHVGMPLSAERCKTVMGAMWDRRIDFRYNKGEEGRGARLLQGEHFDRLSRILGHYPELAPHTEELLGLRPV